MGKERENGGLGGAGRGGIGKCFRIPQYEGGLVQFSVGLCLGGNIWTKIKLEKRRFKWVSKQIMPFSGLFSWDNTKRTHSCTTV